MPLHIIKNDITKIKCDAIVNAANKSLLGGGGVDGAIHRGAGPQLLQECMTLGGCNTGEAKITKGYNLPCKYVIHTVGPIWRGGNAGEETLLKNCYQNSLVLARQKGCQTVAFPLVSAGVYRYPKAQAVKIAMDTITQFLAQNEEMTVYLTVFDKGEDFIEKELYSDVVSFIKWNGAEEEHVSSCCRYYIPFAKEDSFDLDAIEEEESLFEENFASDLDFSEEFLIGPKEDKPLVSPSISSPLTQPPSMAEIEEGITAEFTKIEDGFTIKLLKLIDAKNLKDVECYKKANVSKQTWYKIVNEKNYRPSKATAIAFAIALKLTVAETNALLGSAGYALSRSSKFDLIIEYFLRIGEYDINKINRTLFNFDQECLGV